MYTEFQEPEIAIRLRVPHMVSPVKKKMGFETLRADIEAKNPCKDY